jgi:uncharacterized protein (TIGR02453 family)
MSGYFGPGFFAFLTELKANNDREWFRANKARFAEEVDGPLRRFVADAGVALAELSPAYAEGSVFRIYRDTRFSKDKTPFKTAASAHFSHRSRGKMHTVPGFYLHLEPGNCMGGGGMYRPEPEPLGRVRDRIVAEPDEWAGVLAAGVPILGDSLKRPPNGYDAEHRFVEDLKRKDHFAMVSFSEGDVLRSDFLDVYVEACRPLAPLMAFLTRALDLEW